MRPLKIADDSVWYDRHKSVDRGTVYMPDTAHRSGPVLEYQPE